MKIENKLLEKQHVGEDILYMPIHAGNDRTSSFCSWGKIKSWSDKFVFVDYGFNIQATHPKWLRWRLLKGQSIAMPFEEELPVVVLSNGITVANFSSNHTFKFEDGSVLPTCTDKRCERLKLNSVERVVDTNTSWIDIKMNYNMSEVVRKEIDYIKGYVIGVDIVIVPRPVLDTINNEYPTIDNGYIYFRGIRIKKQSSKTAFINKFCI